MGHLVRHLDLQTVIAVQSLEQASVIAVTLMLMWKMMHAYVMITGMRIQILLIVPNAWKHHEKSATEQTVLSVLNAMIINRSPRNLFVYETWAFMQISLILAINVV